MKTHDITMDTRLTEMQRVNLGPDDRVIVYVPDLDAEFSKMLTHSFAKFLDIPISRIAVMDSRVRVVTINPIGSNDKEV